MGKKKRGHPDVEEILSRPWCYYCERDFDDLKILINHQKAKHFKCERCGRRLNTAGGLSVHMTQVHKETLGSIENALPNRSNLDVEIFGMEGIPDDVVSSHNQRVLSQFAQAEAERRAATGNPGPGGAGAGAVKKPKLESAEDLKKRLAEHKAKKVAEQATGASSGDATPIDGGQGSQSPAFGPGPGFATPSPYPQQQMPYGGPANGSTYSSYPQSYGQQGMSFQQPPQQFPQQSPGFGSPPQFPGPQTFTPPQQYPVPTNPSFPNHGNSQFPPPQYQNGPPQPQYQSGTPRAYGAGSPPMPYHQQSQYQPPRTQTPPQTNSLPPRPVSLPAAPGLPQRPSFGAPPVNAFQMQQMHQGQIPGPQNPVPTNYSNPQSSAQPYGGNFDASLHGQGPHTTQNVVGNNGLHTANSSQPLKHKDKPLSTLTDQNGNGVPNATVNPNNPVIAGDNIVETKSEDAPTEKKAKKEKEKEKAIKMVFSDNDTSPEEKMAKLSRYAFVPDGKEETILGDATTAAAIGIPHSGEVPEGTS